MDNIVVLTGAGISAESGINTFRDADGLWEGHDVMEVASPQGWQQNPELVLNFYNQRRQQLSSVKPNDGHLALVELAKYFNVSIITQNVDDLHERAGSKQVLHLHGELLKSQSSQNANLVYSCTEDIVLGDQCELGAQLRPFIVWFGEQVPMLDQAIEQVMIADTIIIVGTSMQVYPAASLAQYAKAGSKIYYLDPQPAVNDAVNYLTNLTVITDTAVNGLPTLVKQLIQAS